MSADDNGVDENVRNGPGQTGRAAEEADNAGSYNREQYPEDPEDATPPLDGGDASEPPKSG